MASEKYICYPIGSKSVNLKYFFKNCFVSLIKSKDLERDPDPYFRITDSDPGGEH